MVTQETKTCPRCKRELALDRFCNNKNNPDGLSYTCRDCKSELKRAYRQTERGRYNHMMSSRRYRMRHKDRKSARNNAQRNLPLCNKVCELCPEDDVCPATQRHHPDYSEPLIVVYCCDECHRWADKTTEALQ